MAHELDERLRGVETGQARTEQLIIDNIATTKGLLVKICDTIYDDQDGLVVRLDREEQKSKNITRLIWLVVTGAVGMGMTYAATSIF